MANGLYPCALDFDLKKLPIEIVERGRPLLDKFRTTKRDGTISKGQHLVYTARDKPKNDNGFHGVCGLEVIGDKKCLLMYPSYGYTAMNDSGITEIENINTLFIETLSEAGIQTRKPETKATWFNRKEILGQPYRGKDPNCIIEIAKGTNEGLRNEYGIRLASYYGNCKQYQTESCLKLLKAWNKLNEPALENMEIETLLRSALQRHYVYGCLDPILKEVCSREGCPLAKKEVREVTEQEKGTALKLLSDPKLLEYALALGRKRLIGEDDLVRQNIIFIVSGQTKYPISEIIAGYSGSGKNESIRAVSPLFPEGWIFEFTTATPEAIKYIPEDFSGTLVIYELAGIRSETGTLGLRSIGEGKGIKTIYPMREEATGKMTLGETQTNAKNFISTDSGLDIAADLYRRVFKNSMNDSLILTKRVCAKKIRDSSIPEGLRAKLFPEQNKTPYSENDFRNAFAMLDLNLEVVIFPPSNLLSLIELANKKEQEVTLRTQIERILNVIKILALIHQKQRILLKDDANSYVIADAEDVETALTILENSITETITRIEKRQKEALEILEKFASGLNKNEMAEKLNVAAGTAARILKSLAKNGYAKEIETSRPFTYQILDEKTPNSFNLSEILKEYKRIYPKELKTFLERFSSLSTLGTHLFFSAAIPSDLEKKYGIATKNSEEMPTDEGSTPIPETKPKPLDFYERSSETSQKQKGFDDAEKELGLIACPICKEHDKRSFFATQEDLRLHVSQLHGGYPDYVR
jgi:predicted transcriptional regulator